MKSVNLTLLALTLLVASPVFAQLHQHQAPAPLPPDVAQPIHLYKVGLGTFSRKITTSNPEAQAFFDQGFQLTYSFARREAIRSFREAWKRDPGCAMCYWGEAWAWGPSLNEPMFPEQSGFAYAAIQKALALKSTASAIERAFIDAMALRYVENFDAARRTDHDRAYAEAMRQVYEKYPDDLDAGTLYADSLFLLEPRPGPPPGRRPRLTNLDAPNTRRIHEVLETLLAKDPRHPGACHWYVHATEGTLKVGQAQACAEFLGKTIPGASHINHMPSHTFNEVGRWGDSVRANIEAWHSDLKAVAGEGIAIYPSHNLHMLVYAASMDGQAAIAMRAGKDYGKLTGNTGYHALTMIRFGRFDEVPEVKKPLRGDIAGGMWEFAQGYASLRAGRVDPAKESLMRLQSAANTSQETFSSARHPALRLLGLLADILEGEIARTAGDLAAARAAFQRAVALDDALDVDEPEPIPFPARHWLGALLLETGSHAEAERVYREDLKEHPHNGWSLLGLQKALVAQGKPTGDVDADLERSWSRSDTWIRASRF
jgi:tetratricopeptide (TPR) repeat protein